MRLFVFFFMFVFFIFIFCNKKKTIKKRGFLCFLFCLKKIIFVLLKKSVLNKFILSQVHSLNDVAAVVKHFSNIFGVDRGCKVGIAVVFTLTRCCWNSYKLISNEIFCFCHFKWLLIRLLLTYIFGKIREVVYKYWRSDFRSKFEVFF